MTEKKKNSQAIFFILSSVILFSCANGNEKEHAGEGSISRSFLQDVKTVKTSLADQNEELALTGKVEYDSDKVINYFPLVNGIVDRTWFSLGHKVEKGQVLLDIRSPELTALQAEFVAMENEVKIARRELRTAQSLYQDNMSSEKEWMEAQAKAKQAEVSFEKIKNDISVYGIDKGNGIFSIQSPMSGYIVRKNVTTGSTVSTEGEPLFTVADLSTVWITAHVYAGDLRSVRERMEVSFSTLSYPGEEFYGKINTLSQIFDPEENVVKARIIIPNEEMRFKPGMSVVVRLKNETGGRHIAVPSDALILDDNTYFVVIENSPGSFDIKKVIIQGHYKETAYIASGLSEGENVVVKNQLLIYSGLKDN